MAFYGAGLDRIRKGAKIVGLSQEAIDEYVTAHIYEYDGPDTRQILGCPERSTLLYKEAQEKGLTVSDLRDISRDGRSLFETARRLQREWRIK